MTFGDAVEALKKGEWVCRPSWNGKNMHLYLEEAQITVIGVGVFKGQKRYTDPYIVMYTAKGTHQPGWNASQQDVLAEDWQIKKQEN